jgi:hypothetical protein
MTMTAAQGVPDDSHGIVSDVTITLAAVSSEELEAS